jgi:hypothetical protein
MDGGASVVLYSENSGELLSWYTAIKDRITMLLDQSVQNTNFTFPIYTKPVLIHHIGFSIALFFL